MQRPPDYDKSKKYPLILDIHGGPHSAYGYVFDHEFQWMAAKGYVVLYPNPRGSTSYGQDFAKVIQNRYPGDDFKGPDGGRDELVARGIADRIFQPTWFRGSPWEDEADFKARSPITYIDKVTTPLMLIEGEADLRTPSGAGGEQMFRALKYRRVPAVMVQFPGETHELSRSGKPRHRVERLEHILAWFDKYLMERGATAYDVN